MCRAERLPIVMMRTCSITPPGLLREILPLEAVRLKQQCVSTRVSVLSDWDWRQDDPDLADGAKGKGRAIDAIEQLARIEHRASCRRGGLCNRWHGFAAQHRRMGAHSGRHGL